MVKGRPTGISYKPMQKVSARAVIGDWTVSLAVHVTVTSQMNLT